MIQYETALKTGKYMVVVHGSVTEASRAREIIERTHPELAAAHEFQPTAMASAQAGY